jgi:16S rRNA (adenine1518-N6/adenine1519-N6)-dimethyltransferase
VSESPTDRTVIRSLLAEAGVRPSKKLGQNFLADPGVVREVDEIVRRWAPETIVEIGPGLGALTEMVVGVAEHVIALEVDGRLAEGLERRLSGKTTLEVVHEDVLRFRLEEWLAAGSCVVVGSLPYRITAPILKWLIDRREHVSAAVLITQREVAEKIAVSPGKDGSALGILVRAYADVEIIRRVARGCFVPVPEVESTLWTLTFRDRPRFDADPEVFFPVVRALYGTRRKMIRGALRAIVPPEAVADILREANAEETARGEELDFAALDRIAAAIAGRNALL